MPACPWLARTTPAPCRHSFGNCQLHSCCLPHVAPQPVALLPHSCCSRGQATPGNAAYGACKRGLVQLCASLAAEAREANKAAAADGGGGQVSVHICSPGMVATDLLLRYATNPRSGGWAVDGGWLEEGHTHRLMQDVLAVGTRMHTLAHVGAHSCRRVLSTATRSQVHQHSC